ncbi:transposase [uncultured Dysosmobacter sp.]|uniref:transposase n=1 Tax=uncultured Dysosmobacter sp. TaxID=2591384 RepID=UPI00345CAB34
MLFTYTKADLNFRRFHLRGKMKVGTEWILLAMAYNVLRMHHKAQNGRVGNTI